VRDCRQGALITNVAARLSSPTSTTINHHPSAQDGPQDLRRQTHQQAGLIRCRWHPHARPPGRDVLRPVAAFSFVTFFYADGVERISCNARAPVRVTKESRHRVRGGLRSSKDLRTIGRRWQPRSALTPRSGGLVSQTSPLYSCRQIRLRVCRERVDRLQTGETTSVAIVY